MDRHRNLNFLLNDLSRRYVLRFEERARAISLTLPQCRALVRLESNAGVSQSKLAELTDVEPMRMVRIVDRMEAQGLVERRSNPADRRARRLFLTVRAKPLLARIWELVDLTRAEVFAGVSRTEREAFLDVLERAHRNVCALEPIEPSAEDAVAHRAASAASAPKRGSKGRAGP